MSPADVTALRASLDLNPLQLAERLGVPARLVLQWESGDCFPTRRHCQMMGQLAESVAATPTAAPSAPDAAAPDGPHETRVQTLVQRLLNDPEFERRLRDLVTDYLGSSSGKSDSVGASHEPSDAPTSVGDSPSRS